MVSIDQLTDEDREDIEFLMQHDGVSEDEALQILEESKGLPFDAEAFEQGVIASENDQVEVEDFDAESMSEEVVGVDISAE